MGDDRGTRIGKNEGVNQAEGADESKDGRYKGERKERVGRGKEAAEK